MEEVLSFLEELEDDRQQWKIVYSLKDIVVIVLFGTLADCDEWVEIAEWAKYHQGLLKRVIELAHGVPSHDTIQRVMASIKPETFKKLLETWQKMLNNNEGEKLKQILAIDGKTIRGNGNKNQDPLHIVSAWSKESGVCFGQKSADSKGKEVPMIKALLEVVSVRGQIVTIDAIGTQKEIVEKIQKGKGDYVLAVKDNQKILHEDIQEYFSEEKFLKAIQEQGGYLQTGERERSQYEKREYWQTNDVKWLPQRKEWVGLSSIGMTKTTILHDDGTQSEETRYYITSLEPNIEDFARAVRGHWSVESMHWHLDVTFREDKNHTLNKTSAENMNIIRKWALVLLKTFQLGKKYSLRLKRRILSWGFEQHLEAVLAL
ncbi:putative transposase - IS1548 [Spirochaetia bacterium]|nr:putative transposase - IS1548 [Spirochaetia bacterium]